MPTLHVRSIPEDLYLQIQRLAETKNRSLSRAGGQHADSGIGRRKTSQGANQSVDIDSAPQVHGSQESAFQSHIIA